MTDISIALAGYRINLRVGGIFLSEGRVLLNRLARDPYWFLPGGRVVAGESSDRAIRREIREELGIECRIVRPVFLLENFFAIAGEPFHEIGIYYLLEPEGGALPADGDRTPMDGGILFHWHPVAALAEIDFRPALLAERIRALPADLQHIVSRD